MASKASLLIAFFLLFSTCIAHHQQKQQQQQQQQNQCQIRNIDALEPNNIIQAEAGVTEFWDANNQQFQCAGVDLVRHRIQPGGLLLPSYVNDAVLAFIEKGRGVHGVVLPGCPETYEYSSSEQQRGQRIQDRHQKVENLNEGDVVAIPAGAAHWLYNDGDSELVAVVFFDTRNIANQLDENNRRFFLAGNPQAQSQQQEDRKQSHQDTNNTSNIFSGFGIEFIIEAFKVNQEIAEKLQGKRDQRRHIVNVEHDLQFIRPSQQQQQHDTRGRGNGLEETICSLKLKENINNPSNADFVNPQAGRISNLNDYKFPILQQLQLSIERGELSPYAIRAPHWTLNAHSLVYITHGSLRVQIVNDEGNAVFDDEVREGQVVVIPQNFAVIKKAGEQGSRWISFKTNENAVIFNLAGHVSAIRSMPLDVVANAYQLSRNDAQRLKFGQQQTALFSPSSSSKSQGRASA